MWREEEDFFGDPSVVKFCHECNCKMYHGDNVHQEEETERCFCSTDCMTSYLKVEDTIGSVQQCDCCGYTHSDISAGTEFFCDLDCAMTYYGITDMEL